MLRNIVHTFVQLLLVTAVLLNAARTMGQGVSIESQSNPIAAGTIVFDGDRADWDGILPYSEDTDGTPPGPELDYHQATLANDGANIYLRLVMNDSPSGEAQPYGFRHNLYIDSDQDRTTGFYGGGAFLPTGSDYLVQGPALFAFVGSTQEEFTWNFLADLAFNDTPTTDIETMFSIAQIGSPDEFDFLINGANSDFNTEDFYPEFSNDPFGEFFTYVIGDAPTSEADFDEDGDVDGDDFLLWQTGFGTESGADKMDGDWDNDGDVDGDDFLGWQAEFGAGDGAGSNAVPEPAAGLLLLMSLITGWTACGSVAFSRAPRM